MKTGKESMQEGLNMIFFLTKGSLQMWLKSWRWGNFPGLSGWTLNEITSVLIKGWQREVWHKHTEEKEAVRPWRQSLEWCGHEPRDAGSLQKLGLERNRFSPLETLEEAQPCRHLDLGLQNWERTNCYCFKLPIWWWFATAATGC